MWFIHLILKFYTVTLIPTTHALAIVLAGGRRAYGGDLVKIKISKW